MKTINKFYKLGQSVYKNELTFEQYKANLKELQDGKEELNLNLKTKTVKQLKGVLNQLGCWHDSRDKKDSLIEKVYDHFQSYFLIGKPVSYILGEGTHDIAEQKLLNSINAEMLAKFYEKRNAERAEKEKAVENPQTLEQFRTFIQIKGKDSLTPEQLETFESLAAELQLKRQKTQQEQENKVSKINIENVEFKLHKTKHSKTEAEIFTVIMINRVEKEDFVKLRTKAKNFGGYYSRFTNLRADPPIKAGFNFKTEKDALSFMELQNSEQSTTERKQEHKEDIKDNAMQRVRESAEKQIEKANEVLNAERLTNTARRASQAASTEQQARQKIKIAKKMLLIADGFDNGKITYLHGIRNQKQLEQLESLFRRAFSDRLSTLNLTYNERIAEQPKPLEDINFVTYPYPQYGGKQIIDIFIEFTDTAGMKQDVAKILKYAKRYADKNDNVILKSSYDINLFKKTANKISDKWQKARILDNIQYYERLQKMGLTSLILLKAGLRELAELTQGAEMTQEQKNEIELKELERSFINKKIDGFFPTPQPLIDRMFEMAKVFEDETILEPSAGLGHIATAIKEKYPDNDLNLIECSHSLSEFLSKKQFKIENCDFLETSKKYDVIFMNPPFEKHQDIDHVKHAYSLLKSGGRLVSIMAGNKGNSQKKVIEFMEFVNEFGYMEQNEAGSFKSAYNSTGVSTVTIYLEKPVEAEPKKTVKEKCKDIIVDGAYMLF